MDPIISVETRKPLERVREDLAAACARRKFGVLGVHDLRARMAEKGVDFAPECLIFEVCNPHQARRVLEADLRISTALPCRIAVFRTVGGGTRLATIRPRLLLEMFGAAALGPVADEVERTLVAIIEDAAAGAGEEVVP